MLADFCKHRFLLSLSPAIPPQCGGVHKMKVTNFLILLIQVSQVGSTRPERAKAHSPGQRPGYNSNQQSALKGQKLCILPGT